MYHTGTPEWIFMRAALEKIAQMKFGFIHKKTTYYKLIRKFSESLGLNRLPYSGVLAINSHQMNKESNQMIFTSHVSLSFENCLDLFLN